MEENDKLFYSKNKKQDNKNDINKEKGLWLKQLKLNKPKKK